MKHSKILATVAGAGMLAAAAASLPAQAATKASSGVLKAAGCPNPIVVQTDWYPEVDHNEIYVLAPKGTTTKTKYVGPLVDPRTGKATGVNLEMRDGGGAINFKSATDILYTSNDVFAGYISTDESLQNSKDRPTVAVVAPREKSPQIIMWDPATYPDVKKIADLKAKNVKVHYFDGSAWMDYLTGIGTLDTKQIAGDYDGSPSKFIAAGGKDAQQGFSTAEPYQYQNDIDGWKKPVAYQLIADTGWDFYPEAWAVKPETMTKYDKCLKALVPMVQAAQVAYQKSSAATEALIVQVVKDQANDWGYTAGTAASATKKSFSDGIISNGPDKIVGNFDMAKVQKIIDAGSPVFTKKNSPPKAGIKAEDLATNKYIDPKIGLK